MCLGVPARPREVVSINRAHLGLLCGFDRSFSIASVVPEKRPSVYICLFAPEKQESRYCLLMMKIKYVGTFTFLVSSVLPCSSVNFGLGLPVFIVGKSVGAWLLVHAK